jgi:hypothetical protein
MRTTRLSQPGFLQEAGHSGTSTSCAFKGSDMFLTIKMQSPNSVQSLDIDLSLNKS